MCPSENDDEGNRQNLKIMLKFSHWFLTRNFLSFALLHIHIPSPIITGIHAPDSEVPPSIIHQGKYLSDSPPK